MTQDYDKPDFRALCDELLEALYYETGATSGDWTMLRAKAEAALAQPKPPSLKRVALLRLDTLNADLGLEDKGMDLSQIRRALEALPDD